MLHASEMATVWVLRAGDRDQLVKAFLDDGEAGLVAPSFPDGRGLDRTKALRILGVGLDDEPTRLQEATIAAFLSFVRRMEIGDLLLMIDPSARGLVCGVISGDYHHRDDLDVSRARHRRAVEWRRRLPFTSLPERLAAVPAQRLPLEVVPDGRLRTLALACSRGETGQDPWDRPATERSTGRIRAPRRDPAAPRRRRPSQVERDGRRCAGCLVTKPAELFPDGSDHCLDCV